MSIARCRMVFRSAGGGRGLGCWVCAKDDRHARNKTRRCPLLLMSSRRRGGSAHGSFFTLTLKFVAQRELHFAGRRDLLEFAEGQRRRERQARVREVHVVE